MLAAVTCAAALSAPPDAAAQPAETVRKTAADVVIRIQRADYEGDRATLQRLHDELTPLAGAASGDRQVMSRVRYWQGFALWRRALNGFSDAATPAELERDLQLAIGQFEKSLEADAAFVDSKLGIASCVGNIAAMHSKDQARVQELLPRIIQLTKESQAAAPENSRVFWVRGPQLWWIPADKGGGKQAAVANYEQGLEFARKQRGSTPDPLDPAWGEPELLMSLAWSHLNLATPNPAAAEDYAKQALALVPHWRYVRDVLLPQIKAVTEKKPPQS